MINKNCETRGVSPTENGKSVWALLPIRDR
jgi:hypothetical protein